jgi:hypothetical protein
MMGWWFPGRTLIVVLPLMPLALTLLIATLPAWGKLLAACLAAASLAFTLALQRAVSDDGFRLAVDPFDMTWGPFRASAHVFPNYQQWTAETVLLTAGWLTLLGLALGAVVWRAYSRELLAAGAYLRSQRLGLRALAWRRG